LGAVFKTRTDGSTENEKYFKKGGDSTISISGGNIQAVSCGKKISGGRVCRECRTFKSRKRKKRIAGHVFGGYREINGGTGVWKSIP